MRAPRKHWRNRRGHSLLEVLAALVIINVAVLGFLRVQQHGDQHSRNLLAHAAAASAVDNLAAYVMMNPRAAPDYAIAYGAPPPAAPPCRGGACTERELARHHLALWKCGFETWAGHAACDESAATTNLVPDGDGQARHTGGGLLVTVRWGAGAGEQTLSRTVARLE